MSKLLPGNERKEELFKVPAYIKFLEVEPKFKGLITLAVFLFFIRYMNIF